VAPIDSISAFIFAKVVVRFADCWLNRLYQVDYIFSCPFVDMIIFFNKNELSIRINDMADIILSKE
jgi:hypothetical protein